jgi:hypothetical protein
MDSFQELRAELEIDRIDSRADELAVLRRMRRLLARDDDPIDDIINFVLICNCTGLEHFNRPDPFMRQATQILKRYAAKRRRYSTTTWMLIDLAVEHWPVEMGAEIASVIYATGGRDTLGQLGLALEHTDNTAVVRIFLDQVKLIDRRDYRDINRTILALRASAQS